MNEPVQIGGAFLVSCGQAAGESSSSAILIGCRATGTDTDLSDLTIEAYVQLDGTTRPVQERPATSHFWQRLYEIPAEYTAAGNFILQVPNQTDESKPLFQKALKDLLH